jgi:prefoldin subunit 5
MKRENKNSKIDEINNQISMLDNEINRLKESTNSSEDHIKRDRQIQEMELRITQLGAQKLSMEKSQDFIEGIDQHNK